MSVPTPAEQETRQTEPRVEELPYPSCQVPSRSRGQIDSLPGADTPGPQPKKWQPCVTWIILTLNVFVWAADSLSALAWRVLERGPGLYPLLEWGAKNNTLILEGQLWRLATAIFLHIGLVHLAFNAYAIYMIGPQIECFFGPYRTLSIYMLSGIYGVLFSFALSSTPSAGASGAIFGLIGTQAAFFFRYRNAFGERGRRQFYGTLVVIAINMVLTFTASGIDMWGHIGGLFAGIVLGWSLTPRYALTETQSGSALVDLNHPGRWGIVVAGATAVLVISTWLTIAAQGMGV